MLNALVVLDLFSGIGGFSLGLEWAGRDDTGAQYFETVAFCEQDRKCRKLLKELWPGKKIYIDVETLTYERLKRDGIPAIDVITGGFPCQDISLAGPGGGINAARSGLWREFARLIGEIRPRYAIIENVSALRSRGLEKVLCDLAKIGYDAEWHCIPASAIGAYHRRDRIWIISYPRYHAGSTKQKIKCEMPAQKLGRNSKDWMETRDELAYPNGERQSQSKGIESERETGNKLGGVCRSGREKDVADTDEQHDDGRGYGASEVCRQRSEKAILQTSPKLLYPHCKRSPVGAKGTEPSIENPYRLNRWEAEPPVCGVAHGFPGRVDRLKQLGNSIVPQIAEMIGRAIMEVEGILRYE